MEDFMGKLAQKIWPAVDRIGNVNGVFFTKNVTQF